MLSLLGDELEVIYVTGKLIRESSGGELSLSLFIYILFF